MQHVKSLNPIVMMVLVVLSAMLLTYIVQAGQFDRKGEVVVPGTYRVMPKENDLGALLSTHIAAPKPTAQTAHAAGILAAFAAIPLGLTKNSPLVVLVLLVGGMFGVLKATGAVDAGADRLIQITAGNKYVLVPTLMLVLGLGSTFMGFISEYLVLIPVIALLGDRLGYNRIFAVAVVGISAKIGYATSVTNPLALVIAQPLAHVPLFSGIGLRLALFVVFMTMGIGYALYMLRPDTKPGLAASHEAMSLSWQHTAVLACLGAAAVVMVVGFLRFGWKENEVSTLYVALSMVLALAGGLSASRAANAFVEGMKSMMLAALLIGLAGSVQLLLQNSFVLDTMIAHATDMLHSMPGFPTAVGLLFIELFLGVLIPSTAGKVAVSMPILAPIAQMSGVSGQTTVLAFILGNGLCNMITPTSGMLLAYIAASKVTFSEWIRFIAPLFAAMLIVGIATLGLAVLIGY